MAPAIGVSAGHWQAVAGTQPGREGRNWGWVSADTILQEGPQVNDEIELGKLPAWTTDLAIAEVVSVLPGKNSYNLDRETIRDLLLPIIELPRLKVPHKRLYRRIFQLYTSLPLDYIDAYHVALMEQRDAHTVLSYDKHFDSVAGIERREP